MNYQHMLNVVCMVDKKEWFFLIVQTGTQEKRGT